MIPVSCFWYVFLGGGKTDQSPPVTTLETMKTDRHRLEVRLDVWMNTRWLEKVCSDLFRGCVFFLCGRPCESLKSQRHQQAITNAMLSVQDKRTLLLASI